MQIEVNIGTLNIDEVIQKTAGTVKCTIEPKDIDCDIGMVSDRVDIVYGETFKAELDEGDVNAAHVTWNKMAEISTMIVQGADEEEAIQKVERSWWRGTAPKFIKRQRTKLVDRDGNLVTHRQK